MRIFSMMSCDESDIKRFGGDSTYFWRKAALKNIFLGKKPLDAKIFLPYK